LDRLVDMARARKVDLARLSITALVDAFAEALEAAAAQRGGAALAQRGSWLVMAAELVELRSRLMLPASAADAGAAAQEAEALRRRLLGRAEITAAARWLDARTQLDRDVFPSGAARPPPGPGGFDLDACSFLRACLDLLSRPEPPEDRAAHRPPPFRMADAVRRLTALLASASGPAPLAAFLPEIDPTPDGYGLRCRLAVSATFAGALELARDGRLSLAQETDLRPVWVAPPPADPSLEPAP
jgi:segregation and condensation protein A